MVVQPKIRGFICTTAHPAGCHAVVNKQIDYAKSMPPITGPKNVLVIGASTGYGLASRIVSTFAAQAKTIGVFFEKKSENNRLASAGWYNSAAFEEEAHKNNFYAKSINGDAFSHEIKQRTADLIRQDLQKIDLVVYSLASPRRIHPDTQHVYASTLKPIGRNYTSKTVDAFRGEVKEVTLESATDEEVTNTIAVMGGEDWEIWMDFLAKENLLADNVTTVAYSYVGPELTHPIYKEGTIGKAKDHLKTTADKLNKKLSANGGRALISVNKAVVTQASAAIPVVPLYISLLFKLMKENNTHEGCIEQIYRLFHDSLYTNQPKNIDSDGQIRLDDLEMDSKIQQKIAALWPQINTENLSELTDIEGYRYEFHQLFGFDANNVDYSKEVDPHKEIMSLSE